MKQMFLGMFCLVVTFAIGCSSQVRVTGKVVFEDGSPLTEGKVIFENDAFFQAVGRIQPDGSYTLGSYKLTDGVPRGTYKVYISGAVSAEEKKIAAKSHTGGQSEVVTFGTPVFTKLIHTKYEKPETSGLVCDVKKSMKYDIKVEPPAATAKRR